MTAGVYAGGTHTTWQVGSRKRTNIYHKLLSSPSKFRFIFQVCLSIPLMFFKTHIKQVEIKPYLKPLNLIRHLYIVLIEKDCYRNPWAIGNMDKSRSILQWLFE